MEITMSVYSLPPTKFSLMERPLLGQKKKKTGGANQQFKINNLWKRSLLIIIGQSPGNKLPVVFP